MKRLAYRRQSVVVPILTVILLMAGIGTAAGLYYSVQRKEARRQVEAGLRTVAELQAKSVVAWRRERVGDATIVAGSPHVVRSVEQYLHAPAGSGLEREISALLTVVKKYYGYANVLLLDRSGNLRLSVDPSAPISPRTRELVVESVHEGKPIISDLERQDGEIFLSVVSPLFSPRSGSFIGVVLFRIDPQEFLYPQFQNQPLDSPTAETLLVRRDGDHVLFLNELRHQQGAAMQLRLPLNQPDLPAAKAIRGEQGIVEGRDYRGAEVLAAVRPVPDSSWFLVAKVDLDEVYAPLRGQAWLTGVAAVLLLAAAGAVIALFWRRQEARFYRDRYEAEHERLVLAERYDYLSRYANDIILRIDDAGRIVDANERAVEAYGYEREELLRLNIPDLRAPSALPELEEQWREVETAGSVVFETVHRRKDGAEFPVEVSARLFKIDGRPFRQSIIRDITERKKAEEELRRVNRTLRVLGECNQAVIRTEDEISLVEELCRIITETGGYPLTWVGFPESDLKKTVRPVAAAGLSPDSIRSLGPTWADEGPGRGPAGAAINTGRPVICHDVETDPVYAPWRETARERGYAACISLPLKSEAGTFGALSIHAANEGAFNTGEVALLSELADDLAFGIRVLRLRNQQREAAETLRKSEARLEHACKVAALGSWDLEFRTGDGQWSGEVYKIFGVSREEFRPSTNSFLTIVHPDDRDLVQAAIRRTVTAADRYDLIHRIIRPDGTQRYVRGVAEAIRDEAGTVTGMAGTVQDITEFKRLEEQFQQAQKLESIGRLAGGIAHDFNNLLTVINGYCGLLMADLRESDPVWETVAEIQRAGEKAASLTAQLLAFSRKQVMQPARISLNTVVVEADRMLRRVLGEDIDFVVSLSPSLRRVMADPGQILQVLMNLAVNARDAMPDGGTLVIETANADLDEGYAGIHQSVVPGRYVQLSISDTGCGMDEETQKRLFEPFFTTKEAGVGTGLGLSTAYGIVRQSGGWIWVYSELRKGTTFKIYLPEAPGGREEATETRAATVTLRGDETILVVEDHADVRRLMIEMLTHTGYGVLSAGDGAEALSLAERHPGPIHLLVTDVVMPGLTGREIADRVRRIRPETKVLYVSGYTHNVIMHHGVPDPGIIYLQKPFTPEGLAAKVREALGDSTGGS